MYVTCVQKINKKKTSNIIPFVSIDVYKHNIKIIIETKNRKKKIVDKKEAVYNNFHFFINENFFSLRGVGEKNYLKSNFIIKKLIEVFQKFY